MGSVLEIAPAVVVLIVGLISTLGGMAEMSMFLNQDKRRASGSTPASFMGGVILLLVGICLFLGASSALIMRT